MDQALGRTFPLGPFQLLDEVGFDIGEKVSHVLHEAFGERMTPPQAMATLIKQGRLGRKVKKGFYRYDVKGKPVDTSVYESIPGGATRVPFPEEELRERPVLLFLNEAVRCLEEASSAARAGDVGAVFGLGFPPFRQPFRPSTPWEPRVVSASRPGGAEGRRDRPRCCAGWPSAAGAHLA